MQALSDNTLYYALSTIAQCVAALFAFLGAFVLFRLQSSDARLKDLASTLADATTRAGKRGELELLISGRRYREALSALSHASGQSGEVGLNYSALQSELAQLDAIRLAFAQLLWPSFGLILAAILGISLVDQYRTNLLVTFLLIGLTFLVFAFIMWRMALVMRRCLGVI